MFPQIKCLEEKACVNRGEAKRGWKKSRLSKLKKAKNNVRSRKYCVCLRPWFDHTTNEWWSINPSSVFASTASKTAAKMKTIFIWNFVNLFCIFISLAFATADSKDSREATSTVSPSDVPDFVSWPLQCNFLIMWRSFQSIPCKVPTFVKILPISFRRQMRRIWSGVPMNSDCGKQVLHFNSILLNEHF